MPLYEFECKSCRHTFEELVSASSRPTCPTCASTDLEKLLSGFAIHVHLAKLRVQFEPESERARRRGPKEYCRYFEVRAEDVSRYRAKVDTHAGFAVGGSREPVGAGASACGRCGDPRGPGACRAS